MASATTNGDQATRTDDRAHVVTAACVGAVVGGLWGWLYLTSSGARLRDRIDPVFDGVADALDKIQSFRAISARVTTLVVLLVGLMLVPQTARADIFVVPWIGGHGGDAASGSVLDLGGAIGVSAASIVDVDLDVGYSPGYFGSGITSSLLTAMGDVTLGIPFGPGNAPRFRPYLTGGLGLIRSHLEIAPRGYGFTRNDFGVAFGGGLAVFATDHVGVRGDLRYVQSLQDGMPADAFGGLTAGSLHYWRTSIGVVIR